MKNLLREKSDGKSPLGVSDCDGKKQKTLMRYTGKHVKYKSYHLNVSPGATTYYLWEFIQTT